MQAIPIELDRNFTLRVIPQLQASPSTPQARTPLLLIFLSVCKEFFYQTLRTLPASFAAQVLGIKRGKIDNVVVDVPVFPMKTLVWMVTTVYYFFENILYHTYVRSHSAHFENQAFRSLFLDEEINPAHFSQSGEVDSFDPPPAIPIQTLHQWIDKLNLTDPAKPDYVGNIKEFQTGSNQQTLHKAVDKIISHIEGRTPTVGAPNAQNYTILNQFYNAIERNLSSAMGRVQWEIDQFNTQHRDQTKFTQAENTAFRTLNENRARLILEIAYAAQGCAARWSGQAIMIYQMFQGGSQAPLSLEDHLFLILRRQREKIATEFTEETARSDSHAYSKYIEQFGTLLGLGGAQGVVEYLGAPIPWEKAAAHFKSGYSVNAIIRAVQEEYRENPLFRTSVREWVREQLIPYVAEVPEESTEEGVPTDASVQKILNEEEPEKNLQLHLGCTLSLAKQIIDKQISWDMAYQEVKKQFKKGWIDSKLTNESSHFVKNKTATLSSEIMELLLVSFGIFFPQNSSEVPRD